MYSTAGLVGVIYGLPGMGHKQLGRKKVVSHLGQQPLCWGCPNIPQSPAKLATAVHPKMLNRWGQARVFLVVDSHQPNSTH